VAGGSLLNQFAVATRQIMPACEGGAHVMGRTTFIHALVGAGLIDEY
jgi:hypothetical protein